MRLPTCVALSSLALTSSAQVRLDIPRAYLDDNQISFRLIADLDGDTDPDILGLVSDGSNGNYVILRNDGTGELSQDGSIVFADGGLRVSFADVTGDGHADLIGAGFTGVEVLPGDGAGNFGPNVGFSVNSLVRLSAAADIDGDGADEIAELHYENGGLEDLQARWWDWNGSTFVPSASISLGPLVGGTIALDLAAEDATSDGVPDMILAVDQTSDLMVFATAAGAPTLPAQAISANVAPGLGQSVTPVDVDLDGDADLIVSQGSIDDVLLQVLVNDGGNFSGLPPQTLKGDSFFNPYELHFGDWDGDGDVDAVTNTLTDLFGGTTTTRATFVENLGNAVFGIAGGYATPAADGGAGMADFDGDGFLDYASERAVKFGDGSLYPALDAGVALGANEVPTVADWEGDGDADVYVDNGIWVNDGQGLYEFQSVLPPLEPGLFFLDAAAAGDFDGDGRRDFFVGQRFSPGGFPSQFVGMRLVRDTGLGTFEDAKQAAIGVSELASPSTGMYPTADLDADGDVDVVVPNGTWDNDGTGFFVGPTPRFTGTAMRILNVDGDLDLDLITRSADGSEVALQVNDGAGGFTPTVLLSGLASTTGVGVLDLDADGDLDAVVSEPAVFFQGSLKVYLDEGSGLQLSQDLATNMSSPTIFAVDDVDGDSILDLLAGGETQMLVLRGLGAGTFDSPQVFGAASVRDFFDTNEDGDLDPFPSGNSWRFQAPSGGAIRQFGSGSQGAGGAEPLLGASGPARLGSPTMEIHVRRAVGGTVGWLAVGFSEAELVDFPFLGMTTFLNPATLIPISLSGAAGVHGAGSADLPVQVAPAFVGVTFFHQAFLVDSTAADLIAASNALEVLYGAD